MQLFLVHQVSIGAAVVVDFLFLWNSKYNYQCFTDSYNRIVSHRFHRLLDDLKALLSTPIRKLVIGDIVHID